MVAKRWLMVNFTVFSTIQNFTWLMNCLAKLSFAKMMARVPAMAKSQIPNKISKLWEQSTRNYFGLFKVCLRILVQYEKIWDSSSEIEILDIKTWKMKNKNIRNQLV